MNNYQADAGKITRYRSPGGPGIRIDSSIHAGYSIPPYYDSMIAKLCARAMTREETIARMRRAITEYVIIGVKTTLRFSMFGNEQSGFIAGNTHHISFRNRKSLVLAKVYMRESETR